MPFTSITSKSAGTVLALAAGSLLLGLAGAGTAVADDGPASPQDREYAIGEVVSRGPLTVRSGPSTHAGNLGRVHPGQKLRIECKERGENVAGNRLWYRLHAKQEAWVAARYVKDLTPVQWCRL
ncbi:SH3 domain-containing protein [Streptomyces sp. NPDC006529]|uniref:SH3 domain-containing protein n=1 Tax=Streptomyces sp. NPDC006529 TaxID=3157177 RepID=UPI0033B0CE0D